MVVVDDDATLVRQRQPARAMASRASMARRAVAGDASAGTPDSVRELVTAARTMAPAGTTINVTRHVGRLTRAQAIADRRARPGG